MEGLADVVVPLPELAARAPLGGVVGGGGRVVVEVRVLRREDLDDGLGQLEEAGLVEALVRVVPQLVVDDVGDEGLARVVGELPALGVALEDVAPGAVAHEQAPDLAGRAQVLEDAHRAHLGQPREVHVVVQIPLSERAQERQAAVEEWLHILLFAHEFFKGNYKISWLLLSTAADC